MKLLAFIACLTAGTVFTATINKTEVATSSTSPVSAFQEAVAAQKAPVTTPTPTPVTTPTPEAPKMRAVVMTPVQALQAAIAAVTQTPTPTPAPPQPVQQAPKVVKTRIAPGNYDRLLQAHFGASWQYAKKVMLCESSGRPDAIGPTDKQGYNPIGLMQIKNFPGRPSTEALKNPEVNIAHAAMMVRTQGWAPWECR